MEWLWIPVVWVHIFFSSYLLIAVWPWKLYSDFLDFSYFTWNGNKNEYLLHSIVRIKWANNNNKIFMIIKIHSQWEKKIFKWIFPVKHLAQCLAHSSHSGNISYITKWFTCLFMMIYLINLRILFDTKQSTSDYITSFIIWS